MKRYQYIDLFCGCGGLSLGFEQAGFIPRAGIDFKESAINTYRKHFKNLQDVRDIGLMGTSICLRFICGISIKWTRMN